MPPRPLIAAWNTFVRHQGARSGGPGMATPHRDLLDAHGAPVPPWFHRRVEHRPTLTEFLADKGYPRGPLLMTDWDRPTPGGSAAARTTNAPACTGSPGSCPASRGARRRRRPARPDHLFRSSRNNAPRRCGRSPSVACPPWEQMLSHFTPAGHRRLRTAQTGQCPGAGLRASDGWGLARLLHVAWTALPSRVTLSSRTEGRVHARTSEVEGPACSGVPRRR